MRHGFPHHHRRRRHGRRVRGGAGCCRIRASPSCASPCWKRSRRHRRRKGDFDLRVSAVSRASQRILAAVGAWPLVPPRRLSPYEDMIVWDAAGKPRGAGAIHFSASATERAESRSHRREPPRAVGAVRLPAVPQRVTLLRAELAGLALERRSRRRIARATAGASSAALDRRLRWRGVVQPQARGHRDRRMELRPARLRDSRAHRASACAHGVATFSAGRADCLPAARRWSQLHRVDDDARRTPSVWRLSAGRGGARDRARRSMARWARSRWRHRAHISAATDAREAVLPGAIRAGRRRRACHSSARGAGCESRLSRLRRARRSARAGARARRRSGERSASCASCDVTSAGARARIRSRWAGRRSQSPVRQLDATLGWMRRTGLERGRWQRARQAVLHGPRDGDERRAADDRQVRRDIFIQAPPQLGNQYRDDDFLQSYLRAQAARPDAAARSSRRSTSSASWRAASCIAAAR